MSSTDFFPKSYVERLEERERMVETQLRNPQDGRDPVCDERVLEAMRRVPRHVFVPLEYQEYAYEDRALPIACGQTISQPYIVGKMTELLEVEPGMSVLEGGSGSGYQAAVLAQLGATVKGFEFFEELAHQAQGILHQENYSDVEVQKGDVYTEGALSSFQRMLFTFALKTFPEDLMKRLSKEDSIFVAPIGELDSSQVLTKMKCKQGEIIKEEFFKVRFVPNQSEEQRMFHHLTPDKQQ